MKKIIITILLLASCMGLIAQTGTGWAQMRAKYNFKDSININGWMVKGTIILPSAAEINYVDGVTSAIQNQINAKLNISDTAGMLSTYINASDTSGMLAGYATDADVALKVNIADTAAMLSPLWTGLNAKADTSLLNDTVTFADELFSQQEIYNVKDYGAVGDGVANDTEEIQACLDAAKMGTVWFPTGVYLVDSLNFFYGTNVKGAGWEWNTPAFNGTIIKSTTNAPIIHLNDLPGLAYQRNGFAISDLCIFGNNTGANQDGILVETEAQMTFNRVMVGWCGANGFRIGTLDHHVSKVYILNCTITSNELSGIYGRAADSHQLNVIDIINCNIGGNNHGIDLLGLNVIIRQNNISNNDSCGINMYAYDHTAGQDWYSLNTIIEDNYIEDDPIYIAYYNSVGSGTCSNKNIRIDNNYLYMAIADLKGHTAMISLGQGAGSTVSYSSLENIFIGANNYFTGTASYVDMSAWGLSSTYLELTNSYDVTKYLNTGSCTKFIKGDVAVEYNYGAPVAGTALAVTTLYPNIRFSAMAAPVVMTADPPIVAGLNNQRIRLMGYDDVKTVTFNDGTSLSLVGDEKVVLGADDWIELIYVSTYTRWQEVSRSEPNSPVSVKKYTIGWHGATGCDSLLPDIASHGDYSIEFNNIIPAKARVTDIEIVCTEAFTAAGAIDITAAAGNATGGAQFIAALSCDDINEVVDVFEATGLDLTRTVKMNYAAATDVWITANPDVNYDTMTAGKWTIYITYMNYNGR